MAKGATWRDPTQLQSEMTSAGGNYHKILNEIAIALMWRRRPDDETWHRSCGGRYLAMRSCLLVTIAR